jgi:lipoprotein-releasing system ATP-binding protein
MNLTAKHGIVGLSRNAAPTGNLDSANSKIVFDMLQELSANKGNTIITVTHDIDFAHRADRIIEIADGRIVN